MKIRESHKAFGAIAVWLFASVCACVLLLSGCSDVLANYRHDAARQEWSESVIETSHFRHRVWISGDSGNVDVVHVYIEGDGVAWQTPTSPSSNPTPRDGLMFRLMALDAIPSIYLGRPCYFETDDKRCDIRWWTFQRYGDDVVKSMVQALRLAVKNNSNKQLVLIGHSGGGALAVLMAQELSNVSTVVTLAGNLDTQAWTSIHGYAPLAGSGNPAESALLAPDIVQRHFIAEKDEVMPAQVLKRYCDRYTDEGWDVACPVVPGTTHTKGWESKWPSLLTALPALNR